MSERNYTDEAEARQVEQKLQHLQKMEAFSRLVGGASHNFNNLLTIICSYADLLLEETRIPEDLQPFLLEMQQAGRRAAALTTQLLAFTAPPSAAQGGGCDLNAALQGVGKLLPHLVAPQLELELELTTDEEPCATAGSQSRWEQSLLELAALAREAMPHGGSLHLTTEASATGGLLSIRLQGRGPCAVNPAALLPAFAFVRPLGGEAGLHEGMVRVSLPAPPPAPATPPEAPRGLSSQHRTVLLVEDETTVRQLTRNALTRLGFGVLEARTAEEAMTLAGQAAGPRPDVLVTDVLLPGMSGCDLAEALAASLPHLRVLYTSGYPGQSIFHGEAMAEGSTFLQKPFAPRELAACVCSLLERPPRAAA